MAKGIGIIIVVVAGIAAAFYFLKGKITRKGAATARTPSEEGKRVRPVGNTKVKSAKTPQARTGKPRIREHQKGVIIPASRTQRRVVTQAPRKQAKKDTKSRGSIERKKLTQKSVVIHAPRKQAKKDTKSRGSVKRKKISRKDDLREKDYWLKIGGKWTKITDPRKVAEYRKKDREKYELAAIKKAEFKALLKTRPWRKEGLTERQWLRKYY